MLSLSIYSSSQGISIALHEKQELICFLQKKIKQNKIDDIFLLIQKLFKKNISKIGFVYFSTGPGSYTALRSVKAIAQGISVVLNAKIRTVNEFDIYLSCLNDKFENVIVFFKNYNKFFYQFFRLEGKIYRSQKEFLNGDLKQVYENIYKKKKKLNKLVVVSDFEENVSNLRGFKENEIFIFKTSAKDIVSTILSGHGNASQEISYHHTYYE